MTGVRADRRPATPRSRSSVRSLPAANPRGVSAGSVGSAPDDEGCDGIERTGKVITRWAAQCESAQETREFTQPCRVQTGRRRPERKRGVAAARRMHASPRFMLDAAPLSQSFADRQHHTGKQPSRRARLVKRGDVATPRAAVWAAPSAAPSPPPTARPSRSVSACGAAQSWARAGVSSTNECSALTAACAAARSRSEVAAALARCNVAQRRGTAPACTSGAAAE
eukprot:scaffold12761_cov112-Isochrysis_galbana.AAC.2